MSTPQVGKRLMAHNTQLPIVATSVTLWRLFDLFFVSIHEHMFWNMQVPKAEVQAQPVQAAGGAQHQALHIWRACIIRAL